MKTRCKSIQKITNPIKWGNFHLVLDFSKGNVLLPEQTKTASCRQKTANHLWHIFANFYFCHLRGPFRNSGSISGHNGWWSILASQESGRRKRQLHVSTLQFNPNIAHMCWAKMKSHHKTHRAKRPLWPNCVEAAARSIDAGWIMPPHSTHNTFTSPIWMLYFLCVCRWRTDCVLCDAK